MHKYTIDPGWRRKPRSTITPRLKNDLNVATHLLGALLSVVALILLVQLSVTRGEARHMVSFAIFGSSLIVLYSASVLYHSMRDPGWRRLFNIVDHSAIYILIAGTYTPFTMTVLKGALGWTIFGIVWGMAIIGIVFKLFYTGRYDIVSTIAYVAMGWVIIFAIKPLIDSFPFGGLMWLFAGGLAYTTGAILYMMKRIRYNHAIFHLFVLAGSFCHFIAVYQYILPGEV